MRSRTMCFCLLRTFLAENPNEQCHRLQLIFRKKQGGNDTNRFEDEINE